MAHFKVNKKDVLGIRFGQVLRLYLLDKIRFLASRKLRMPTL